MKKSAGVIAVTTLGLLLLGCPEKKGTFEEAGEKLDEATEDAGDKLGNAVEEVGEKVEKAADKARDAVEDVADEIDN